MSQMHDWGKKRMRCTRPERLLKRRVQKRRASMYRRWNRAVERQWAGYHDLIGMRIRLELIAGRFR